ncbi:methylthioribulose-1-phosphate dehydratase [Thermoactinomyces sp. DSM 45891]|uniref:methylthioribulose 1-phosphate dehydratase n=1 Tax=Thermoactinomyces sp. DSM 45891 TaxID=1761907 RepID=UPI00091C60A2|nr:methylthioribulose 1-phosphate dehydratase [Thermoactinomyces sp. DSM 45891]SFX49522.1 methylthioribulose-1-phosphate dehydratase [Thermoactinomyces sp. DSM 45891]
MIELAEKWRILADIKDELAVRDWFLGTSGNLSIKVREDPLTFLITASGKDKRKRTEEDFLLVDQDGKSLGNTHLTASAEVGIHAEIYQRTNASCCLHVHTLDNNLISELHGREGRITFRGQELIKAFGIWEEDGEISIPIIPNHADLDLLSKEFGDLLLQDPLLKGILIRNHGITTWGATPLEAKKYLEAFEFLFSYHIKLRLLQPNLSAKWGEDFHGTNTISSYR